MAALALSGCVKPIATNMVLLPNGHMGLTSVGTVVASRDETRSRAIIQAALNNACSGEAKILQLRLLEGGGTDSRYTVTAECL